MILAIIFDFDNTLYDYDFSNNMALNKLFNTLSINFNINKNIIKDKYNNINKYIKNSNNTNNKFNKAIYIKELFEELGCSLLLLDEYIQIYNTEFNNTFKIYNSVLSLFQSLKKKGIKIGICSNNLFVQQYDKLKRGGLLEYIDFIQTRRYTYFQMLV